MSNTYFRRIMKDHKQIKCDFDKGIYAEPLIDDIKIWNAVILGPKDTVWEGGCFKLTMEFPNNYPTSPPVVKFVTPVFHPNIYSDGKICLDILDKAWTPMYNASGILVSLQVLLTNPNPDSPANTYCAKLFKENILEYNRLVRECVENSWIDNLNN